MQMITWVYVSTAEARLDDQGLLDLLTVSRRNNAQHDVTGVLCYASGNFMQALEGDESTLMALERNLRADTRHYDVTTIVSYPIRKRVFGAWSMALSHLDKLSLENQADFVSLTTIRVPQPGSSPIPLTLKLLDGFRRTMM
jgi:hypothetical protein